MGWQAYPFVSQCCKQAQQPDTPAALPYIALTALMMGGVHADIPPELMPALLADTPMVAASQMRDYEAELSKREQELGPNHVEVRLLSVFRTTNLCRPGLC